MTIKRKLFVIFGLNAVCAALLFCILSLPRCAFAQDTVALAAPAGATLLDNPAGAAHDFVLAVKRGDLWYAAAALLFAAVGFLRFSGKKLHAFIPDDTTQPVLRLVEDVLTFVYDSKLGGWVLNWATAIAGCLASMKLAGLPVDAEAWRAALVASTTGTAAIELWDDLKAWWPTSKLRAWLAKAPTVPPAAALVLLLPLLSLSSCSSVKGFLVSGETLDQAGAQFEVAAPIFFKACSEQQLPVETCRKWRDFARRFKVLYRPSANAWHAAALVNEAAVKQRYSDMIGPLLAELAEMSLALSKAGLLPSLSPPTSALSAPPEPLAAEVDELLVKPVLETNDSDFLPAGLHVESVGQKCEVWGYYAPFHPGTDLSAYPGSIVGRRDGRRTCVPGVRGEGRTVTFAADCSMTFNPPCEGKP